MIITRTPLRISFVGGGSDLPSFYRAHSGAVVSAAINKYVYINLHKSFSDGVRVAYSRVEEVKKFSEIEHAIVRNSAELLDIHKGLEITSIADIPSSGSGLGSSSSFAVGLLNAFNIQKGNSLSKIELARQACIVEIDKCGEPIGKQDQFAAACGGINIFRFQKNDDVVQNTLDVSDELEHLLFSNLLIFYTGQTRSASKILKIQDQNNVYQKNINTLKRMMSLVDPFADALLAKDINVCGDILHENWLLKKTLSKGVSNPVIDEIYDRALGAGALGGKLLGAGGSGFMAFIVPLERQQSVSDELSKLRRVFWGLDRAGSTIIHRG